MVQTPRRHEQFRFHFHTRHALALVAYEEGDLANALQPITVLSGEAGIGKRLFVYE